MNRLEAFIHGLVGDYPWLKGPLVAAYQLSMGLFARHQDYSAYKVTLKPGYFFGFHDISPWSLSGDQILAHRFNYRQSTKKIEREPIDVGFFEDSNLAQFRKVGSTTCWNWQQGASLQWINCKDPEIVANVMDKDQPQTRIWSRSGSIVDQRPGHIASVSKDGKYGASFCFHRLSRGMPGYGYSNIVELYSHRVLSVVALKSGRVIHRVPLDQIVQDFHEVSMSDAYHFFSHTLFSPDSARLLFFHRWRRSNGVLYTRMYSMSLVDGTLHRFKGSDFSHISWCTNDHVLAYCRDTRGVWGYYLFEDLNEELAGQAIGRDRLHSDGHPHFDSSGSYFVTDTYPDRFRVQKLIRYDLGSCQSQELVRFRIPFQFRGSFRCDFHPRIDWRGEKICFDSAHSGIRSLCILDLAKPMQTSSNSRTLRI